jgi:hypothetical protein
VKCSESNWRKGTYYIPFLTVQELQYVILEEFLSFCLFNYFTEPERHTAVAEQLLHVGHILYHVRINIPTAAQLLCFKTASYHKSNITTYSQQTRHVSDYTIHHLAKYKLTLQVTCNYWYYTIISLYFHLWDDKKNKKQTDTFCVRGHCC